MCVCACKHWTFKRHQFAWMIMMNVEKGFFSLHNGLHVGTSSCIWFPSQKVMASFSFILKTFQPIDKHDHRLHNDNVYPFFLHFLSFYFILFKLVFSIWVQISCMCVHRIILTMFMNHDHFDNTNEFYNRSKEKRIGGR